MKLVKPSYHFSSDGWINDPNGFVFFAGRFHLFFQYTPFSSEAGKMCWGHAVSDDLVKWEQLPIALRPDRNYDKDGCWSGSSIVKDGRLYLIYTGHSIVDGVAKQTQNLAFSENGVYFTKYDGNPIIDDKILPNYSLFCDFRDPSIYFDDGKYFLLIGNRSKNDEATLLRYVSKDLIKWDFYDRIFSDPSLGKMTECPSSARIGEKRILILSLQNLMVKNFDFWNRFSSIYTVSNQNLDKIDMSDIHEIDHGLDFYAPEIISQGNIMIARMSCWERDFPSQKFENKWCNFLTIPRVLSLEDGQLIQKPIESLKRYFGGRRYFSEAISEEKSIDGIKGNCGHLHVGFFKENTLTIKRNKKGNNYIYLLFDHGSIKISREHSMNLIVSFSDEKSQAISREFYIDSEGIIVDLYLDKEANELYFNDGRLVFSLESFEGEDANQIVFSSEKECKIQGFFEEFIDE
jgi:beta-fructofuranosidase